MIRMSTIFNLKKSVFSEMRRNKNFDYIYYTFFFLENKSVSIFNYYRLYRDTQADWLSKYNTRPNKAGISRYTNKNSIIEAEIKIFPT